MEGSERRSPGPVIAILAGSRPRSTPRLLAWGLLIGLVGCQRAAAPNPYQRYLPEPDTARQALVRALDAWRQGREAHTLALGSRSVQVIDAHRRPGQVLKDYRIRGPAGGEGPLRFAVTLTLDHPSEVRTVQYVVFGIDPLWVFQQDDFDMLNHMDHPADSEKPEAGGSDPQPLTPNP